MSLATLYVHSRGQACAILLCHSCRVPRQSVLGHICAGLIVTLDKVTLLMREAISNDAQVVLICWKLIICNSNDHSNGGKFSAAHQRHIRQTLWINIATNCIVTGFHASVYHVKVQLTHTYYPPCYPRFADAAAHSITLLAPLTMQAAANADILMVYYMYRSGHLITPPSETAAMMRDLASSILKDDHDNINGRDEKQRTLGSSGSSGSQRRLSDGLNTWNRPPTPPADPNDEHLTDKVPRSPPVDDLLRQHNESFVNAATVAPDSAGSHQTAMDLITGRSGSPKPSDYSSSLSSPAHNHHHQQQVDTNGRMASPHSSSSSRAMSPSPGGGRPPLMARPGSRPGSKGSARSAAGGSSRLLRSGGGV
eukprot:scaffold34178_cov40-Prasinocladus_malaysianus.AAC.3